MILTSKKNLSNCRVQRSTKAKVYKAFYVTLPLLILVNIFRELEQKAAAMAREIEGSSTNKLAIELENGEEEEEAFSAVHRSGSNNRGMSNLICVDFEVLCAAACNS